MKFNEKTVFGTFESSYDKRSLFVYKTFTQCEGYIIRKSNWRALESSHEAIYKILKKRALFYFSSKIRTPLLKLKARDIYHYDLRADYRQVLCLKDYDDYEMDKIF
tara:strand:- start:532 stop:849 length:318 start_codon:yes stop_codon:yes gene_type:complete